MNPIGNKESKIFPNQVIDGRDQELYPKRVPDVPAKYHEKLNTPNMCHMYPDLFESEENENDETVPKLDENGLPIFKSDDEEEDDEDLQVVPGGSSSMTSQVLINNLI